jgi:hypothetical protein
MGHAVAVDVVWMIAKTTAVASMPPALESTHAETKPKDIVKRPVREPAAPPLSSQPAAPHVSAAA